MILACVVCKAAMIAADPKSPNWTFTVTCPRCDRQHVVQITLMRKPEPA